MKCEYCDDDAEIMADSFQAEKDALIALGWYIFGGHKICTTCMSDIIEGNDDR
jgi:hypothetical protein